MHISYRVAAAIRCGALLLLSSSLAFGQQPAVRARILQPVDNQRRITLSGNTHVLARAEFDQGAASGSMPMKRMMLLLSRAPEQQAALDKLVEDQQTPSSPNYRRWLTPTEFGQKFGPADSDVETIAAWLQQQGFQVERVASGKNIIEFSGDADQVQKAFHTSIHKYVVSGKEHWANSSDPEIPEALAPVVKGIVSLNNFPRKPQHRNFGLFSRNPSSAEVTPQFTVSDGTTSYYAVGPADFATIYNTAPLLQAGNNGAGQVIAIVGHTNVHLQDVADFRSFFNLGAGNTSVVLDGPDPGIVSGDETESLLDLEWANAVAPGASVVLVSAADTATTSGLDLAAFHIIENNTAGVMSESYGACEASLGTAGNQFYQQMWQQAAAQGITVVVSSGDDGSAGCDYQGTSYVAQSGLTVNGIASTPFNVAAGGTDFDDANNSALYWNGSNNPSTGGSVKSYIPEMTWNESCAASATAGNLNVCPDAPASGDPEPGSLNLWAGSGGASNCTVSSYSGGTITCLGGTPKPAWQSGPGVPSDGVRDVPDVSFFSATGGTASKSFYIVCQADALPSGYSSCQRSSGGTYFLAVGGTSVAAPGFAAITALAEQKAGTRLGNINYLLYPMAAASGASCTSSGTQGANCVFNDVAKGNISVPCIAGSPNCSETSGSATGVLIDANQAPAYSASAGYDLATGLGSVNAANLATAIGSAVSGYTHTSTSLTLNGGTTAITANHGEPINVAVAVSPTAATGPVSLIGDKGAIDSGTLVGGAINWGSSIFPGGNYMVKAHYAGDGTRGASDSNGVSVSISPEDSNTFLNLLTWDENGNFQSIGGNTVAYASNYALRMDVTDAAGTVSTQGVVSKCYNGTASCPTGTLTLTANGSALDGGSFALNSAGHAEDRSVLAPGAYNLAVTYPGDASYRASSSATLPLTVTKGETASSVSIPSTVYYGTDINFSAETRASARGAALQGWPEFLLDGDTFSTGGDIASNKDSQYQYVNFLTNYFFNTVGNHVLSAQYTGDSNYQASTAAPVTFTVVPAPTTVSLSVSPNPATPNIPVTLSLMVQDHAVYANNAPSGAITFYDNGVPLNGTITYPNLYNATAQMTYIFTELGTHNITGSFAGDAYYSPSATPNGSAVPLVIQNHLPSEARSLWFGPNPAVVNQLDQINIAFCPGVGGGPAVTGTVSFSDSGTPLNDQVTYSSSPYYPNCLVASIVHNFTAAGAHSLAAAYSGDSIYTASSVPASPLNVVASLSTAVFSVAAYPSQPVVGNPATITATIQTQAFNAPAMTGTATFIDNGTPLTEPVNYQPIATSGLLFVSTSHTFTAAGAHSLLVKYNGDSYFAASQSQPTTITVVGPLSLSLDSSNINVGSAGGTYTANLWISNNTDTPATVSLSCTPDSASARCSLSQSQLTLGASVRYVTTFTYTVPGLTASLHTAPGPWRGSIGIVLAGVLAGTFVAGRRRCSVILALIAAALLFVMLSCGGGGAGGGSSVVNPSKPASKTYTFTIKGTSGTNTDTQILTVTVGS